MKSSSKKVCESRHEISDSGNVVIYSFIEVTDVAILVCLVAVRYPYFNEYS